MHKLTSIILSCGMILAGTPAFAGTIAVVNSNEASVSNTAVVTANSGGNSSAGDRVVRANNSYQTDEGAGGNGGDIVTGDAISTAFITNEVNTTETVIEDNRGSDENRYNETLRVRTERAARSADASESELEHEEAESNRYEEHNLSETADWAIEASLDAAASEDESLDADTSAYAAASGSSYDEASNGDSDWETSSDEFDTENSESASVEASASSDSSLSTDYAESSSETRDANDVEESNDRSLSHREREASASLDEEYESSELEYTRTYVDEEDDIVVANGNSAALDNAIAVDADSGDNHTHGAFSTNRVGGNGGNGGDIMTGVSDSRGDIVSTVGRTITRIIRR